MYIYFSCSLFKHNPNFIKTLTLTRTLKAHSVWEISRQFVLMPAIIRLLRRDSEFPTRRAFMNLYRNERGSVTPSLMAHIMQIKVQRFVKLPSDSCLIVSFSMWVTLSFRRIYLLLSCFCFLHRGTLLPRDLLPVEKIKLRSRTSPIVFFAFLFISFTLGIAVLRR